jgi:HK97 family phage prohead protease
VFGNIDDWGDRMHPGSFAKTISEKRDRVKHLWNHNFGDPPIAKVLDIREVGRDGLPEEVLSYAPDATGGLLVKREYLENPEAEKIYQGILAGTITEMSFGFDATKFDFSTEQEKQVREIREVRLYDTSDVNWGMNGATIASKTAYNGMSAEMFFGYAPAVLAELAAQFKSGRTISAANMEKLKSIHQFIRDLGFEDCMDKPVEDEAKTLVAEAAPSTSLRKALADLEILKIKYLGVKL